MAAKTPKTYEVDCAGCNRRFKSKSPRAKWHSAACKQRAARVRVAEEKQAEVDDEPSRLVERLRADLEKADASESFEGLLALEIAARLVKSGPQGFSMLARDLRAVRAAALGEEPPVPGAGEGAEDPAVPAPDPATALILDLEGRRDARIAEAASAG